MMLAENGLSVDGVVLRRCTAGDAEALALVGAATFLDAYAGFIDGNAIVAYCARHHTEAAYTQLLGEPSTCAWLAEVAPGGAPVGYALLTAPDLPMPDLRVSDVELKRIYLLTRFHGSGLGQRIMNQVLAGAKEMDAGRVLLGVHRDNARALRFYGRNGFAQVGIRRFQVGHKVYNDLILGREL